jgi:glucosamine--fructose-6-phosphate aminotransferase (isomerizing)
VCGIVGYKGREEACNILIDALKRLEYRGYDSAGIAVWRHGHIKIGRRKGKVDELRQVACQGGFEGTMGVAHTRWATHGAPSERNAHPHRADDIVVVHNGIIENYMELRLSLQAAGREFHSDTDTEVIPHLIADSRARGMTFVDAVRAALQQLRGSYALAIMCEKEEILVAAKKESPLILGIGDNAFFIASDAPAILDKTNRFVFLEDDDVAVLTDGQVLLTNTAGEAVERTVHTVQWSGSMAEKGGFRHFMLKEIFEQPRALSDTLIGRMNEEKAKVNFEELRLPPLNKIRKIWMIACGTSYHACLIGKHLFESHLRIPVETDIASEFRYRDPILSRNDLLILVSQSGETADTIAAMKEGKRQGIFTLSVCNVLGSTLAREADGVIFTHAGPEIGVASTKAFTTQISVLFLLMLYMAGRLKRFDEGAVREYMAELKRIPHKMQMILDGSGGLEDLARKYMTCKDFLYLGRGINYPTVHEGALKLKEISYIHAEAYAAGEMKHGPIALIDENLPVVVVSPLDGTYQKTCSNIEEVVTRRGRVVLVTDDETHAMIPKVEDAIIVPKTVYALQPLLSILPLQLLAYHIANLLGTDVDQPRNLAKSVTVE